MPIFYIQVFGHRLSRKASYRRLMRAKEVANRAKLSTRLLELLRSRLTFFYLGDKSKKEVKKQVKRAKYNKKKRKERSAINNCYTK